MAEDQVSVTLSTEQPTSENVSKTWRTGSFRSEGGVLSGYVRLLSVLVAVLLFASAACAQESLRISRDKKPLSGQVDHNVYSAGADFLGAGALVDVGKFSSPRLEGSVEREALGLDAAASTSEPLGQMGVAKFDVRTPFSLNAKRSVFWGNVNERELALLGSHDVVVILDRSRSMRTRDCLAAMPGERPWNPATEPSASRQLRLLSRWEWCVEQAFDLTRQAGRLPGRGVTLVLFARGYDVYEKVALQQFPQIMGMTDLQRGTHIAPPLRDQLAQFFRRKAAGSARPLAIAVITDGVPKDADDIRSAIIGATRRMHNPREISITFLHVGTDPRGQMLLQILNDGLVREGARYDIVKTKPFSELLQFGLTRSLIDAIGAGRK